MKVNLCSSVKLKWRATPQISDIYKQVLVVFGSSLLCLSGGLTIGISAVLVPQLLEDEPFYWEMGYGSWIAATAPISSIFGCLIIGAILDRFGRKQAHVIFNLSFIFGWLFMAFSHNFYIMLLGRFFTGFGLGASRLTSVTYIGEISNPKQRGIMLLFTSFAFNIGVLLSHIAGTFLHWRTTLFICAVPNLILIGLISFFKESPFWLISKGRIEEGTECFRWFRGEGEVAESELQAIIKSQKSKGSRLSFKELTRIALSRRFARPTVTIFFVFTTVQMSGVNVFPFYAHDLLQSIFDENVDTFAITMIVDIIRVGVSLIVCCLGKTMRRKATFISCAYGTTLVLSVMVIYLIYHAQLALVSIPLTLVLFYSGIASAVVSLGWTFVAEIFPTNVRGLGSGVSGAINGAVLSLCVKITPLLLAYGDHIMYGTFAVITFVSAIVLNNILPETRGKRLQDIEDSYETNNKDIITAL